MPQSAPPKNPAFDAFLAKFPQIEPPVTLGETAHHAFSTENEPLGDHQIAEFIANDSEEIDEFTEYVPCFSFQPEGDFRAVVWWKAGLLKYEYWLATFSKMGQPIARKAIASTRVEGDLHIQSVAFINEESVILVAEGRAKNGAFDPSTSKNFNFEMLPTGEIIQYNAALN